MVFLLNVYDDECDNDEDGCDCGDGHDCDYEELVVSGFIYFSFLLHLFIYLPTVLPLRVNVF